VIAEVVLHELRPWRIGEPHVEELDVELARREENPGHELADLVTGEGRAFRKNAHARALAQLAPNLSDGSGAAARIAAVDEDAAGLLRARTQQGPILD